MVSNTSMPFPPNVVDDESCNAVDVQPDHDHRRGDNDVVTVEDYLHESPRSGGFLILGGMRSGIARCGENLVTTGTPVLVRPPSVFSNGDESKHGASLLLGCRFVGVRGEAREFVPLPGRVKPSESTPILRTANAPCRLFTVMDTEYFREDRWRDETAGVNTRRRSASVH